MIAGWMLYATVVGAFLSAAALAAERAAMAIGRPRRWLWVAALAASIGLPLVAVLGPGGGSAATSILPVGAGRWVHGALDPLMVGGRTGESAGGLRLDTLLLAAWMAATAVLLVAFIRSHRALVDARRGWMLVSAEAVGLGPADAFTEAADVTVPLRLSDEFGPAVVGLRRSEIVLPRWILDAEPVDRALVLTHELEHVRAGDLRLYLGGRLAAVCLPWLLPLWWQLHRLRLAVEIDCDARLLGRGVDRSRYGRLLLEVGRRRGRSALAAALAEPVSHLERRIKAMIESKPRHRWLHVTVAAAGALALFAVACASPTPSDGELAETPSEAPSPPGVAGVRDGGVAPDAEPVYVPRDQEPVLTNRTEIVRLMQENYAEFRDAGEEGRVTLSMFVDERGRVTSTRVTQSSGRADMDEAAIEVARSARFQPARRGDDAIGVWIVLPFEFRTS